ncbi:acetylornithine deacetylase [Pseudomonas alkylphenolica]|uniref:Acetylornithine deacetylase n=1 Tax=Pseudomonas alkylphenolica TaxID=237609 RepID=A0A443ZPX0_9PSED|nr:M20 family metallopeptidase [Pseudomonas alkylphenolica]RWU21148.1 acetylornithine deacetylase [Pseudomonas alkylphenolica]
MNPTEHAIELTRRLLRFDTTNPPGNEQPCAAFLATLLAEAGFTTTLHELAPGRASLVAYLGNGEGRPLCFTGHLDTVPLGKAPWSVDPFAGEIRDGRLYGRGSSDMKAGIAAFISAALQVRSLIADGPGVVLVLTASEETGCQGAAALLRDGVDQHRAGAIIVGEMTANYPLIGHKGALWLSLSARGKSAHGSMPERGDNALYKAARALGKIEHYRVTAQPHPVLGNTSISAGTLHAGSSINVVPDLAELGVDIRSLPGMSHSEAREALLSALQPDICEAHTVLDLPAVFSDSADPWIAAVYHMTEAETGIRPEPRGASYFTDACALQHAHPGVPIVILGPGTPEMAHQTDEYCEVARIDEAVRLYRRLITDWCTPGT